MAGKNYASCFQDFQELSPKEFEFFKSLTLVPSIHLKQKYDNGESLKQSIQSLMPELLPVKPSATPHVKPSATPPATISVKSKNYFNYQPKPINLAQIENFKVLLLPNELVQYEAFTEHEQNDMADAYIQMGSRYGYQTPSQFLEKYLGMKPKGGRKTKRNRKRRKSRRN